MARTFYAQVLREFDWNGMVEDAKRETPYRAMGSDSFQQGTFLGTVFAIMPSGKYYTPFACSNVTESEADRDERYMAALERAAAKHGGWIESGEGDPCDLFFCIPCEELPAPEFRDTEIHTWFERDRAHVELRDKRTEDTLWEAWDEDVSSLVEDGFLNPSDWHGSAFEYWQGF